MISPLTEMHENAIFSNFSTNYDKGFMIRPLTEMHENDSQIAIETKGFMIRPLTECTKIPPELQFWPGKWHSGLEMAFQ